MASLNYNNKQLSTPLIPNFDAATRNLMVATVKLNGTNYLLWAQSFKPRSAKPIPVAGSAGRRYGTAHLRSVPNRGEPMKENTDKPGKKKRKKEK